MPSSKCRELGSTGYPSIMQWSWSSWVGVCCFPAINGEFDGRPQRLYHRAYVTFMAPIPRSCYRGIGSDVVGLPPTHTTKTEASLCKHSIHEMHVPPHLDTICFMLAVHLSWQFLLLQLCLLYGRAELGTCSAPLQLVCAMLMRIYVGKNLQPIGEV